jgi:hypothetical protein
LRWRRSIVRDFFYTLKTLPQHVWKLHPNAVWTLILTPLGALVGFLVAITALTSDPLAWAGPVPLIAALGIGAVLTWVIKRYSAREAEQRSAGLLRVRDGAGAGAARFAAHAHGHSRGDTARDWPADASGGGAPL